MLGCFNAAFTDHLVRSKATWTRLVTLTGSIPTLPSSLGAYEVSGSCGYPDGELPTIVLNPAFQIRGRALLAEVAGDGDHTASECTWHVWGYPLVSALLNSFRIQ